MKTIDEAFLEYERAIRPLSTETVAIENCVGRVLAEVATSRVDLPPFDQSAMDGYAVASSDLTAAARNSPVRLPIVATVAAAEQPEGLRLHPGECVRIFTGGRVPEGADAVEAQEFVERDGETAVFRRTLDAGRNLRARAEEIAAGASLGCSGLRLTPGSVGALAAAGLARVQVFRRPRVTVVVTGDELAAPGEPLRPGQIYESNGVMALAWLRARGIEARLLRGRDDRAATARAVQEAIESSDLVITTGGVSVGDKDFVIAAARSVGVRDVFWKVAQKPGKPLYFGVHSDGALLGLPGNPAAVFVGLVAHASRLLNRLEGVSATPDDAPIGRLTDAVEADADRDLWIRCRARPDDEAGVALTPLAGQASHMLSNLLEANALIRVPAGSSDLPIGSALRFQMT